MPRKEFDPYTRLDASDINTYLMDQSVMVFGGTAARDSAIPTPIDGMTAYLQDSDTLTIYNGAAWTPAGTEPALQLINSTSFSAVSSQQLDNVFSASYLNYKIIINITTASFATATLNLRLASGGSPDAATGRYEIGAYFVGARVPVTAGSTDSLASTLAPIGILASTEGCIAELNIYNPFTADRAKFTCLSVADDLRLTGVALTATTAYDGLRLFTSPGTMTGTITVYGIKEN
jgi:hypothetical protein